MQPRFLRFVYFFQINPTGGCRTLEGTNQVMRKREKCWKKVKWKQRLDNGRSFHPTQFSAWFFF